jgi:hypothetical protein
MSCPHEHVGGSGCHVRSTIWLRSHDQWRDLKPPCHWSRVVTPTNLMSLAMTLRDAQWSQPVLRSSPARVAVANRVGQALIAVERGVLVDRHRRLRGVAGTGLQLSRRRAVLTGKGQRGVPEVVDGQVWTSGCLALHALRRIVPDLVGRLLTDAFDQRVRPTGWEPAELASRVATVHRLASEGDAGELRYVPSRLTGKVRLPAGMVRANRPGRALLGLSKLLVGAFGTAAFALTTDTIWQMGDALGALRLTVIMLPD